MKTMCPPGHHHNGFVATHALGHMMCSYTLLVPMNIYISTNILNFCDFKFKYIIYYIVTLHAFYMNLTKYKLSYKKLSRQKVCVRVYVCVCMRVYVCVCLCVGGCVGV